MIKRVLIVSVVIFIIALIIFWFISGGWAAVSRTAKTLMNPLDYLFGESPSGTFLRLPWQPTEMTRGPDISGYAGEADAQLLASGDEDQLLGAGSQQARTFGNPSPYAGRVKISGSAATENDATAEYIEITASSGGSAPVAITNWSLQSAVSGLRAYIPLGAPLFRMGIVNNVQGIYLEPGSSALITTGASPVGTSFRENICSGYLGELQTFKPEIGSACPLPSETLPMTADNLRIYGDACFDYLNAVPQCHFPTSFPSDLSGPCRSFIANSLSYNGCVNRYVAAESFPLSSWRVYLGLRAELWYNTHDVIRLLDEEGRVVDVLTY